MCDKVGPGSGVRLVRSLLVGALRGSEGWKLVGKCGNGGNDLTGARFVDVQQKSRGWVWIGA